MQYIYCITWYICHFGVGILEEFTWNMVVVDDICEWPSWGLVRVRQESPKLWGPNFSNFYPSSNPGDLMWLLRWQGCFAQDSKVLLHTEAWTKWPPFCRQHFQTHFHWNLFLSVWLSISQYWLHTKQASSYFFLGDKLLPKAMMTEFCAAIWCH